MTELTTAVVSVARTARGRYFWAAWWTEAPRHSPFQKPDACNGGAASKEAALADAERVTGRALSPTSWYWAHAVNRMLRGERPPAPPPERTLRSSPPPRARSAWAVLEVSKGATLAEVRRAYRLRALQTHPDRGGDAKAFAEVRRAYERLLDKRS